MPTVTYVVDPLNILTMGLISGDPLNLITDGFVTVEIEDEVIEVPVVGDGGGDFTHDPWNTQSKEKKKKKKKITARVFIDNKKYEETVIVDDLNVNVKDVKLEISNKLNEVKIKILLPEGVK